MNDLTSVLVNEVAFVVANKLRSHNVSEPSKEKDENKQ